MILKEPIGVVYTDDSLNTKKLPQGSLFGLFLSVVQQDFHPFPFWDPVYYTLLITILIVWLT